MRCEACTAETDGFLCRGCGDRLASWLGDMPALLAELDLRISRQAKVTRHGGKPRPRPTDVHGHRDEALRSTPLPWDVEAAELRDVASNELGTDAREIAEHHGIDLPVFVRRGHAEVCPGGHREPWTDLIPGQVEAAVGWLLEVVESVRYMDTGPEIIDRIGWLHAELERAIDRSPVRIFAGPCRAETLGEDLWPACCVADLHARADRSSTRCETCGTVHDLIERRQHLADLIEDALVPLDEVMDALPLLVPGVRDIPASTVRGWRLRGRLVVRSVDLHGRELFRGGDVLDLARQSRTAFDPRRKVS